MSIHSSQLLTIYNKQWIIKNGFYIEVETSKDENTKNNETFENVYITKFCYGVNFQQMFNFLDIGNVIISQVGNDTLGIIIHFLLSRLNITVNSPITTSVMLSMQYSNNLTI